MSIDWGWLAATYAGWRIAGLRASGTRDRQELVLTLEREVPVGLPALRLDADPADWEGLEDELAIWRGRDVD
ncbi:hypothetical protein [Tepidiforma bonchosmolovskayae]|uniref:Uncharacterized protein n=1 Tax=Tepidiforma bonchosmolovskayae TaxID=2601677 RepID=A0ABX6C141_9CHLR|nr:hypothetical protein [Tepidiforma bonchosmolovskayae]QFG02151.1 hypothetical protein Tbon_02180 [Tepidiforma bonchosmolovskayae]